MLIFLIYLEVIAANVESTLKNLPGILVLSVCFTTLSLLALIFRVVPSWLRDGCCKPRYCIYIQGRN